jgi:hypothetical protein
LGFVAQDANFHILPKNIKSLFGLDGYQLVQPALGLLVGWDKVSPPLVDSKGLARRPKGDLPSTGRRTGEVIASAL